MTTLTIGSFRYEMMRALFDGSVGVDGFGVEMRTDPIIPLVFQRMARDHEFDVSDMGFTFLLRLLDAGRDDLVALPAYTARVFRHSCIFVNADAGIRSPADLAGRTIGEFLLWGQDSGVWAKGMLADEYGYDPASSRWVVGPLDDPVPPFDWMPQKHKDGVEVSRAPEGAMLGEMLAEGAIDALISANAPRSFLRGDPRVQRLFPDFEPLERDWRARTGLLPIMHLVVVRRSVLEQHPGIEHALYAALSASKDAAAEVYRRGLVLFQAQSMQPWTTGLVERNIRELGDDWFPFGIEANRASLEAEFRYHYEQGITSRRFTVEDVFAPSLLAT